VGFLDPRRVSGSVRTIRQVLRYLDAHGHDPTIILKREGVDASLFHEPDARLPHAVMIALWNAAVRMTGDNDLGLHASAAVQPGEFGAIEYVARTSQTFGAGFGRLVRYYAVLNDGAELTLDQSDNRAVLGHHLCYPGGVPRQISEYVLGCLFAVFRHATGLDWLPLEVRFPHQEPADSSEHRRLFRAPLRFGCHRSELVIPRSLLEAPLLRAEPALQDLIEVQVERSLRDLSQPETTTDTLRHLVGEELRDGEPTLERLAGRLHMSARTLHRRLGEENTTFRQVVSEVRRELAERHLRERKLAVAEIAFLLGFSEASAFHRAFKRWTGSSPQAYRLKHD
jgi:AraC-like DNA-binding protein